MANAAGTSVPFANVSAGTGGNFKAGTAASNTGGSAPAPTFRMRARDTTLARIVYWSSISIDPSGSSYTGPGPLTDVVLSKIIGA